MSIEKKSLISNRIASKKAIVTKPEGSKVASNKTIVARMAAAPKVIARTAAPMSRMASATRIVAARIAVKTKLRGL
ncbi:MAG TPA: hypothetical protein VGL74_04625 [Terriglobales bacterium]